MTLLLGKDTWTAIPKEQRRQIAVVFGRSAGRGLCTMCWEREKKAGTLVDHETRHRSSADRAEDYEWIRDELPSSSMYARLRAAGARQPGAVPTRSAHPDTVKRALRAAGISP